MRVKAVIFDFSGTLFRCEDTRSWLRGALAEAGIDAPDAEITGYAERLRVSGGQPGGHADFAVPEHLTSLWRRRDLTAADHRAAYTALIRLAGLPWPGLDEILYDRHRLPQAWRRYPDTLAVLEVLAEHGIPVAVLSNIGWDLRPVFEYHGMAHLVASYVLSFEVGMQKPDPRIFRLACDLLGEDPRDVLMVGDNLVADGGATEIGCSFRAVGHLAVSERPRALLDAVRHLRWENSLASAAAAGLDGAHAA
ncbi:MAG: HAD-IA family hydrolase [Streptosporangiaceae bacterium]|nr:HAD-IA family hydrolase [Streptosporangiaceae bacterium]